MNPILGQICRIGIIPVIAIGDARRAVPLARSLVEGGLPAVRVTFRICAAEEIMRAIATEAPEMLLGTDTALNREQVDRVLTTGAKFIASPGFNPDTARYVESEEGLILPGTITPGEMEQAMVFGLEAVKFFPAEQNGGVAKLKAITGPYKTLKWMPTDGVSAKNLMDYLSLDQVATCGDTWIVKKDLIEAENWVGITCLTWEAVDITLGFSLAHVGINYLSAQASERTTRTICSLFGLPFRTGSSSNHVGTAVEHAKAPGPSVHGHIAIGTNNVERTIYHLEHRGVAIDYAIRKTDAKGRTKAVYLEGDFGGFAIHLV